MLFPKDSLLQTALTHEKLRWKKETELEKSKAVEAAVAIAEVKWHEEEERKISEAVEQAIREARDAWKESKQREIGMNVDGQGQRTQTVKWTNQNARQIHVAAAKRGKTEASKLWLVSSESGLSSVANHKSNNVKLKKRK